MQNWVTFVSGQKGVKYVTSNAKFAVLPIFKSLLRSALMVLTVIILSLLNLISMWLFVNSLSCDQVYWGSEN